VDEIGRSAYRDQLAIEEGRRRIVGVNCYQETEDVQEIEIFRGDPRVEREQIERLQRVRAERDAGAVERALGALESAARAGDSIIPATIEAVRSYATIGEISSRLQAVYGTYKAAQHV
jgi:methylmalonyl-CoA mutase N-terminal domain/subunit